MGVLNKILNLFGLKSSSLEIKLPELNKTGIISANCPYCGIELKKFPTRKSKCEKCGQYIYVRTRPIDYKKVLLKENELPLLEEEWEKKRYINKKTKVRKVPSDKITDNMVIDISDEMNVIIKELIKHYKEYCNYDEILRIDEKDRLPIMKYIWSKWAYRNYGIEQDLKYTCPQYDLKDIRLIVEKESTRINSIYKQQQAIKHFESTEKDCYFIQPFVAFSSLEEDNIKRKPYDSYANYKDYIEKTKYDNSLCFIYDIHRVSNAWYSSKGYIDSYSFKPFTHKITPEDLKHYKFWIDGEITQLNEQDFLNCCKNYSIDYPLYEEKRTLLSKYLHIET